MTQKNYLGENLKAGVHKKKASNTLSKGLAGLFAKKPPVVAEVEPNEFNELEEEDGKS